MEMNKECVCIFIPEFLPESIPNQQGNIYFYICVL